jgi:hypothetical protein
MAGKNIQNSQDCFFLYLRPQVVIKPGQEFLIHQDIKKNLNINL